MEHKLDFKVRDYECDLQGVVNNAVYHNYFEHGRHELLRDVAKVDFADMAARGINLVLVRSELDYKFPLRSGDHFRVETRLEQISPIRYEFRQTIFRAGDERLIADGRFIGVAVNQQGRPMRLTALENLF